MKKWFKLSYKSLRETVVYLQGKRKEKEEQMLVWFQFRSFSDTMKEIEPLFRQNKHLKLHRSKIFRAWYKHQIDYMTEHPDIYRLSMNNGSPYDKDSDPYYDNNAPDWKQFDRRNYRDNDDYHDYTDSGPNIRKAAEEGFYTGVGLGAISTILNK